MTSLLSTRLQPCWPSTCANDFPNAKGAPSGLSSRREKSQPGALSCFSSCRTGLDLVPLDRDFSPPNFISDTFDLEISFPLYISSTTFNKGFSELTPSLSLSFSAPQITLTLYITSTGWDGIRIRTSTLSRRWLACLLLEDCTSGWNQRCVSFANPDLPLLLTDSFHLEWDA